VSGSFDRRSSSGSRYDQRRRRDGIRPIKTYLLRAAAAAAAAAAACDSIQLSVGGGRDHFFCSHQLLLRQDTPVIDSARREQDIASLSLCGFNPFSCRPSLQDVQYAILEKRILNHCGTIILYIKYVNLYYA
jgi:hypothetical protein